MDQAASCHPRGERAFALPVAAFASWLPATAGRLMLSPGASPLRHGWTPRDLRRRATILDVEHRKFRLRSWLEVR